VPIIYLDMPRKGKPAIASSLLKNSKAAMIAAIEIHNKPIFKYRYEVVVLLVLNAWELALKAYIYKYLKNVKLFKKGETTKPFDECIGCVVSHFGNRYLALNENLLRLYDYRNKISHFYVEKLDIVVFGLLKQNVKFYYDFISQHFKTNLKNESDLVLLPIGFHRPYSPIDFITSASCLTDAPKELKDFLESIIESTKLLESKNISEPIIVDFKINLTNTDRIKNADILAGIDNSTTNSVVFRINKESKPLISSKGIDIKAIKSTSDRTKSTGILVHEEVSEVLFDEINNIISANTLLGPKNDKFYFTEQVYYRIYSEREHVFYNEANIKLLLNTGIFQFYSPFLFWFTIIPPKISALFINCALENCKHPNIYSIIALMALLGDEGLNWLHEQLDSKFKNSKQAPNYYYTFKKLYSKKGKPDSRFLALRMTGSQNIIPFGNATPISLRELVNDELKLNTLLSTECLSVFNGNLESRKTSRILDILKYGNAIKLKAEVIIKELQAIRI
jgi:hypothetical protein